MSRRTVILRSKEEREKAAGWCMSAPAGACVSFKVSRRTLPQNDRMWAMLTILSELEWFGQRYSPDDWKRYFLNTLRKGRWMPHEDGGMIPIGGSSDLTKDEMSEVIEIIHAFAAREGIDLKEKGEG